MYLIIYSIYFDLNPFDIVAFYLYRKYEINQAIMMLD